jgi:hypothetical protein
MILARGLSDMGALTDPAPPNPGRTASNRGELNAGRHGSTIFNLKGGHLGYVG